MEISIMDIINQIPQLNFEELEKVKTVVDALYAAEKLKQEKDLLFMLIDYPREDLKRFVKSLQSQQNDVRSNKEYDNLEIAINVAQKILNKCTHHHMTNINKNPENYHVQTEPN